VSGVGIVIRPDWWCPVLSASAIISSANMVLFWDGTLELVVTNGLLGLLLTVGILLAVLLFWKLNLLASLSKHGAGWREPQHSGLAAHSIFLAVTFCIVWLGMWAAHVFAGRPPPTRDPEAFKLVAALDLTIMMPALGTGGFLLWRRNAWGYLIAAITATQGALYLLVLSANSALSIARGLEQTPGQLPIWGALLIATTTAAVVLLASVRASEGTTAGSAPTELHRPAV